MQTVGTYHVFNLMGISHKIIRTRLRAEYLDEFPFRLDVNRHISPGILHNRQRSLGRLRDILKKHPFAGKGQENALLLLDSYQELFHRLVPKGPLTHIIIQIKRPFVLIF